MARERLVVIGGVAAGMSAASRARRRNPEMDIVVLEKGQHVSYGACGLPFYLSGEVKDWRDLVVYTPEFFREKRSIDVQLGCEALEIEPGRKTVHARRGSQPIDVSYDKLVIATGGVPAVTIPGADLAGVFQCSDLTGAIRLHEFVDTQQLVSGKPAYFPLGTTANKQGRVAGENAAGGNGRFEGIVGTLATTIF